MKTEISSFCESCLKSLHLLPPALQRTLDDLEKSSEKTYTAKPLAALNDVRGRLRTLVEKLENQHAYLLIFGPLKSGKSTLMNAISGAYVSEVTSLPGYPCLVFVRHAEQQAFSATRYNGRESIFADGKVLHEVIADGHHALADQIRAAEGRGEAFDPRTHFTEAIRRIDIKVPVRSLAESNTVLVDTPGLYSRMNFGYDMLTREFRDSAACAVFVVKTDNLFLEQVFAEFNQLLDLFSRIFLVINLDSHKRDLQPDGSLVPSAESSDPQKIIDAFKTLSMAGPLRRAYTENRVRIHAVDLLSAASAFLSGNGNGAVEPDPQREAFGGFQRDLTDYLNSSDYTREFIGDSLRQGSALCDEVRWIYAGEDLRQLRERQGELQSGMAKLDEKLAAADRLLALDWETTFANVEKENNDRGALAAKAQAEEVRKGLGVALDRWYKGSESLDALEEKHLNPPLAKAAAALADGSRARLLELVRTPLGGSEPPIIAVSDLHLVGVSLGEISGTIATSLTETESGEAYRAAVQQEEVPVHKTLGDWFLFRSAATVRRRLFGETGEQEIAPEIKAQRLPESSREALLQSMEKSVAARFPALPQKFSGRLLTSYSVQFCEKVRANLRALRADLAQQRTALQTPHEQGETILVSLAALDEQAGKVSEELHLIAAHENVAPTPVAQAAGLP